MNANLARCSCYVIAVAYRPRIRDGFHSQKSDPNRSVFKLLKNWWNCTSNSLDQRLFLLILICSQNNAKPYDPTTSNWSPNYRSDASHQHYEPRAKIHEAVLIKCYRVDWSDHKYARFKGRGCFTLKFIHMTSGCLPSTKSVQITNHQWFLLKLNPWAYQHYLSFGADANAIIYLR